MAHRTNRRKTVLLSRAVHPEYRKVIETYIDPAEQRIVEIPFDRKKDKPMRRRLPPFSTGR